jgi:membrane-associated protease RseP (regulator of RpoE activity)
VLDKWIAGQLTVKQFLEQTEWDKVWNYPPEYYLPLFQFARINRIPMVALNVDRTLPAAITKNGWDAVQADQKEGVSRPAPPSPAYRDFLFEVFKTHPNVAGKETGAADKDGKAFRFFTESQTAWDRAMAEALARRVETGAGAQRPLVVGIMGVGHVRRGYGVPHQLRDLGVSNIGTLLPVESRQDCSEIRTGLADAVFALPAMPAEKTPPPRLGVQIEAVDGGVRLLDVRAGSLAEQTGLKRGDIIESIAGAPVKKMSSVVAAVRAQPAGTWLPMQIRRGAEKLGFVVKFPPQK